MSERPGGDFAFLRDGGQVLIRPYSADDRVAVAELLSRLSPESLAMRFHSAGVRVNEQTVDVATSGHSFVADIDGHIVAIASYYPLRDPARAEMAIAVDDAQHERGIGTVLFEALSRHGQPAGIKRFVAEVQTSNRHMLKLLDGLGFHLTRTYVHGVVEAEIDLRPDAAYVARADVRLHVAAAASLEPIFNPRAVAVVGASRRKGTIGHALFRNLLEDGFDGPIYPVNPSARAVAGVRAYPAIAEVPDRVDLAIIVVPAAAVLDGARQCLEAGVRGLVVISAGFAEVGEEGKRRQDELLQVCRRHGVRLIGPNCMGVLSTGAMGVMNGTFAPTLPPSGTVAISSQSGALGIAILDHARRLGIGVSAFVSIGNKADVSSNDLLERWEDDAATSVILLYLESFGNPRRFARIARRVGAHKPIIAVKGGRSQAGKRAAASHTAALAGSDVAVEALFRQAGVIRCDTLEELFEIATLLAHQPLPAGNRVAVLTNAGGLGILCADACEANGLQLPALSEATQAALRALLPAEASVANPVDMLASGSAETYKAAVSLLMADAAIDAVIALFIPPLVTAADDVAQALIAACTPAPSKPLLTCFVGAQGVPDALRGSTVIPSYTFPEAAARALGHAAERAAWLRRPAGTIPPLSGIDSAGARRIVEQALQRGDQPWLEPQEVMQLLQCYGISPLPGEIVHSPQEAAEACRRLGAPVAVKLVSRKILHKSDVGGVQLNLASPEAAAAAYREIAASLEAHGQAEAMDGALVQPMLHGGVECLVGVVTDPIFGPLIAFGLGGVMTEVIGDVAFRLHPLTDRDADELMGSVKASRLLHGYRGSPPADIPALREVLLRISQLVEDVPEVNELDINPLIVREEGAGVVALDARLRLKLT
jgi:acetyl coenzyme A synthetase (ADP forming)-like protein